MFCGNIKRHSYALLIITVAIGVFVPIANALADPTNNALGGYIGMPAQQILNDLGDPLLRTPQELWYRNEARIVGGDPGVPNPAQSIGRNGVVVNGAGGDYPPLAMSRDFCDVVVKLDRKGTITEIENHGPGCFEFIHVLKMRHADPP